ncbi:MAG: FtsW/RodA/SpoVE family cell cycle protein, partial [Gaiellaceae bacterium]
MAIEYTPSAGERARARARRAAAAADVSFLRRLDWLLLAGVVALVVYGLWAINGITHHDVESSPHYFLTRQLAFVAAGVVAFALALVLDPGRLQRYWRPLYITTVAVMLLVFLAGPVTRGSQRWLDIGPFRFQPSEFGKLLFVLAIGGFLAERVRRINDPRTTLSAIGLAALPITLVFMQPDFGTALVYGAALAAVLFIAGTRWLTMAFLAGAVLVGAVLILWALPAAGAHVLQPYQVKRITGFLHPEADPSGATYNITQSKVAVGAGGLDGRGVAGATQTNLSYLPEHATDFVFASFAEQRGFFGAAILLCL